MKERLLKAVKEYKKKMKDKDPEKPKSNLIPDSKVTDYLSENREYDSVGFTADRFISQNATNQNEIESNNTNLDYQSTSVKSTQAANLTESAINNSGIETYDHHLTQSYNTSGLNPYGDQGIALNQNIYDRIDNESSQSNIYANLTTYNLTSSNNSAKSNQYWKPVYDYKGSNTSKDSNLDGLQSNSSYANPLYDHHDFQDLKNQSLSSSGNPETDLYNGSKGNFSSNLSRKPDSVKDLKSAQYWNLGYGNHNVTDLNLTNGTSLSLGNLSSDYRNRESERSNLNDNSYNQKDSSYSNLESDYYQNPGYTTSDYYRNPGYTTNVSDYYLNNWNSNNTTSLKNPSTADLPSFDRVTTNLNPDSDGGLTINKTSFDQSYDYWRAGSESNLNRSIATGLQSGASGLPDNQQSNNLNESYPAASLNENLVNTPIVNPPNLTSSSYESTGQNANPIYNPVQDESNVYKSSTNGTGLSSLPTNLYKSTSYLNESALNLYNSSNNLSSDQYWIPGIRNYSLPAGFRNDSSSDNIRSSLYWNPGYDYKNPVDDTSNKSAVKADNIRTDLYWNPGYANNSSLSTAKNSSESSMSSDNQRLESYLNLTSYSDPTDIWKSWVVSNSTTEKFNTSFAGQDGSESKDEQINNLSESNPNLESNITHVNKTFSESEGIQIIDYNNTEILNNTYSFDRSQSENKTIVSYNLNNGSKVIDTNSDARQDYNLTMDQTVSTFDKNGSMMIDKNGSTAQAVTTYNETFRRNFLGVQSVENGNVRNEITNMINSENGTLSMPKKSNEKGRVRMVVKSWGRVTSNLHKMEQIDDKKKNVNTLTKIEAEKLTKATTGQETESNSKDLEREGLFVKPGLNRGELYDFIFIY